MPTTPSCTSPTGMSDQPIIRGIGSSRPSAGSRITIVAPIINRRCQSVARRRRIAHATIAPKTSDAVTVSAKKWGGVKKGRSEEHTSELQSLMRISYAVFCLKKKKTQKREESEESTDKNK